MVLLEILHSFLSLFEFAWQNKREYFFPKEEYHPLNKLYAKVNKPKLPFLKTNLPYVPAKFMSQLGADPERNIAATPLFQQSWYQRKLQSQYSDYTYIYPRDGRVIGNRPRRESRGVMLNGKKLSSRQHDRTQWNPDTRSQQLKGDSKRSSLFWDKILQQLRIKL